MFRNSLTYYHGTTEELWEEIQKERLFKPNGEKKIGEYWITRGAYFVCENPYIALWYAHLNCCSRNKNEEAVLLSFQYRADHLQNGEIINLMTSDGHQVLTHAHQKYRSKIQKTNDELQEMQDESSNLDSKVLELLLEQSNKEKGTAKGIIASFQEGGSFQEIIHNEKFENPHVLSQCGICPGDHAEICFYPNLTFDEIGTINIENINSLTDGKNHHTQLWPLVCKSLNNVLVNENFRNKFNNYLSNIYPEM